MDIIELKPAIEAILFASGEPVPAARLSLVLGIPEQDVLTTAEALAKEYERGARGVRLLKLGGRAGGQLPALLRAGVREAYLPRHRAALRAQAEPRRA